MLSCLAAGLASCKGITLLLRSIASEEVNVPLKRMPKQRRRRRRKW
jgi:hypothetical protein